MTTSRNYDRRIADQLHLQPVQVSAAISLLDAGNTLPFIARYRKEATHSLDEEQLRQLYDLLARLRAVDERRDAVIASVREQGKLTPELEQKLLAAETLTELEDLYLPYKPKRRTRAGIARERGLQPLADLILTQARTPQSAQQAAAQFIGDDLPTADDALAGARDIVAESISDHADIRRRVREKALRFGMIVSEKVKDATDEKGIFTLYYDYEARVDRLKPYQVLALNRGEAGKILRLRLDVAERDWRDAVEREFRPDNRSPFADQMALAMTDAAARLLLPAIERDVRRTLTEAAEQHAITVFATNLRGLLLQPPLANRVVLGIDPGFRTGSKIAVIDPTGKVLATTTIYPHKPQAQWHDALKVLAMVRRMQQR